MSRFPDGPSEVPQEPPRRGPLLRLALAVATSAVAVTASWWPFWGTQTATGAVNLLVSVTFAATAAVLYEDREQRSTALAIALAAAFYPATWWWAWPPQWQVGPLPLISFVLAYLWFVFGGLALTRYPGPRLARPYERWVLASMAAWICGVKILLVTISVPAFAHFGEQAWWFTIVADRALFDTVTTVFNGGLLAGVVAMLVVLLAKIRRLRGLERLDAAPAVLAAAAVAVCGAFYLATEVLGVAEEVQYQLRIVIALAALMTPASFLTAVVRRQVISSTAVGALPRIYYAAAADDVRDQVRQALRDPDVALWVWNACRGRYVDLAGEPADPEAADGRWLVTIRSSEGAELAVMSIRVSLRHHRQLVESAAHATGVALERQARYEDLQASRARINQAELTARHTIARDLHDGAQQVLLTARLRLAMALRRAAHDHGTCDVIEEARRDVDLALRAIRDLAAGNSPSLLPDGLRAAVPGIVRDLGIPVDLRITEDRLDAQLERNLWFLVSEGVTNVRKHAGATRAVITIEHVGDEVVVRIVDDGCGGACPNGGSGLAGMMDRVHVLRGRIRIDSPAGLGTVVEARLPCA